MTMLRCAHCGAEVDNGLALCELCRRFVVTSLQYLPIYFRNLSRWKPGQAGTRPVPDSRPPKGAFPPDRGGDHVSNVLDEAGVEMVTWARCLADDRPGHLARVIERILTFDEERTFRLLCLLFERRVVSISTTPWAGDFVTATAKHEEILRRITERVVPGWYAGACSRKISMESTCGASTYVVPGLTWVTCPKCGVTTYARDHLETILTEARGWVARPMRLAEAIVALVDGELSIPRLHKRISKWGERTEGRCITPIRKVDRDGDEAGPKCYRMGDVLDLLRTEGQTRLNDIAPIAVTAS